MFYRNTKTGVIIDVPSEISGNWVKIDGGKSDKETATVSISETDDKPVKKPRKTKEEGK
jgi:hypothetical protein